MGEGVVGGGGVEVGGAVGQRGGVVGGGVWGVEVVGSQGGGVISVGQAVELEGWICWKQQKPLLCKLLP